MDATDILHILNDKFTVFEIKSTQHLNRPHVSIYAYKGNVCVFTGFGLDVESAFINLLKQYVASGE